MTAVGAIVAVALGAAGCGGGGRSSGGGSSGGVLRIGDVSSRIDSLNPLVGANGFATLTFRIVYPYLVQYQSAQQIVGDFAKSFAFSDGDKTLTFQTYPDAHWTDGKPLTAADAAWTINTIVKFASGPTASLAPSVTNVISATATSPTSLVVRYKVPTGTALDGLAQIPILPQHVWAPLAAGNGAQLTKYPNTALIGDGPFRVTKYVPNQFELLSRNPGFYGPKPKLSGVGFQFYSSNDALISALRTGALDAIYEVPPTDVASLRGDSSIAVDDVPGLDVVVLSINSSRSRTANPELRNPTVRQAIDLSISKSQMVNVVANGSGSTSGTIMPPSLTRWHDSRIPATAADVAKANQLLDSDGYRRGPGGVRIANGHPMSYTLLFPTVATGVPRVITQTVNDLAAIGIKVTPLGSDFPSWEHAVHRYQNWDFNIVDFTIGFDPAGYLNPWTCAQLGIENVAGYCSSQYDALFDQQQQQMGPGRVRTVYAAQALAAKAGSMIPLYVANAISASRKVGNLPSMTATPLIVNYLSKLWLEQAER